MGIGESALDPNLFAVVDCETTGLHPGAHHRIIELALVTLDDDWNPKDIWCTLLSPERDLGPTDIHGIRGRDVRDAPTFDDVLGEVLDRVAGRILVAHNARFDRGFREHELARLGLDLAPLPTLCTMEIASRTGLGGGRSRLSDCCAAIGAAIPEAHTARGDAVACAEFLAACIRDGRPPPLEGRMQGEGFEDRSLAGISVCFTGALTCYHEGELVTRDRACELAEAAGMVVAPRVTKKLDMLVVADPDSLSGKARKAREYGTRIVAETAFWSMIGVEVS